jgi:SOS response regulatory protein OraA/RecX
VPLEAAYRAGLAVGVELDREALRLLLADVGRLEALSAAQGALRYQDHSTSSLARRLEQRGVAPAQRRQVLETLTRAGVVDDARFAHARAETLVARGAGDLLVADDLRRQGVAAELIAIALEELEPEPARARALVERRGATPKTWRFLAAKGFAAETIEALVADGDEGAVE